MLNEAQEFRDWFKLVWISGDYRRGSTAQRLVPMILQHVPAGSTINDYGSGTGRAEVELMQVDGYRINMVDIAENALEDEARAMLGDRLTFREGCLWDLPADMPHADWGLCINVLMTCPPHRIDQILSEIRRTCTNLFFEAYDIPDVRLGKDHTLTKKNAAEWKAKLSEYWPSVIQEKASHDYRFIFICTGARA
jgi:SAM-dependent methyltransferase